MLRRCCDGAVAVLSSCCGRALPRSWTQGLHGKKEFDGAKECLSTLLQAEPDNASARRLLTTVQKGRAKEKAGQKAMVRMAPSHPA